MELVEKGATANLPAFNQLMVELAWQTGKDFDLGALLEYKEEGKEPAFIYFGNKGDLNGPFFVNLDKDEGVGDTVGEGGNKETMKIMSLELYRQIHLCVWDYGAIENRGGEAARFADDNIKITILDDQGNSHSVKLPDNIAEEMGNCVCIATIDNSSPMGAKFVNQSIIGTSKKFKEMASWLTEVARQTD